MKNSELSDDGFVVKSALKVRAPNYNNIRILTDEIDMDPARAKKECGSELA